MTLKKSQDRPPGYADYTVYPLEGIWSPGSTANTCSAGCPYPDEYNYELMIRQPQFVTRQCFLSLLTDLVQSNDNEYLGKIRYETICDGKSVQMLHLGPFEREADTLAQMEIFMDEHQLKRATNSHREIYLTDYNKTAPENLKTVIRFSVEQDD
jgi:hypothetical protein